MYNNKELNSLTWKHFWKRKRQEIWAAKWGILAIQMLLLFSASFAFAVYEGDTSQEPATSGFLALILGIELGILFTGFLLHMLISWLRSNWKLATKDARKELKRRNKKK